MCSVQGKQDMCLVLRDQLPLQLYFFFFKKIYLSYVIRCIICIQHGIHVLIDSLNSYHHAYTRHWFGCQNNNSKEEYLCNQRFSIQVNIDQRINQSSNRDRRDRASLYGPCQGHLMKLRSQISLSGKVQRRGNLQINIWEHGTYCLPSIDIDHCICFQS